MAVLKFISFFVGFFPYRWQWRVAGFLAFLWWDVLAFRRFTLYRNISIAFPEMAKAEKKRILRESIAYALEHREEALDYALQFARDMEERRGLADKFVGMYVNQRTLDYGEDGRRAVRLFLERGVEAGIIPTKVHVDFIE